MEAPAVTAWEIREFDPAAESDAAVQSLVDIINDVAEECTGNSSRGLTVEMLRSSHAEPREHRLILLAAASPDTPDVVVGESTIHLNLRENLDRAHAVLVVRPEARRQGLGRALAERSCELLRGVEGVATVDSFTAYLPDASTPLPLPIPEADFAAQGHRPEVAFPLSLGFRMTNGTGANVLALDSRADAYLESARSELPDGFALRHIGPTPENPFAGNRLSEADLQKAVAMMDQVELDAPSGDTSAAPATTTPEAVAQRLATAEKAGSIRLMTVIEGPSGELAAAMDVSITAPEGLEKARVAEIQNAVVMPAFRRRGLGWALKNENLRELRRAAPGLTELRTFNASQNTGILRINRAMGFVQEAHVIDLERPLRQ